MPRLRPHQPIFQIDKIVGSIAPGNTPPAAPMVLVYDTTLLGGGSGLTVGFYLGSPNLDIDWGDGSALETASTSGSYTHDYASEGTYNVELIPNGPSALAAFRAGAGEAGQVMLEGVTSWGDLTSA